MNFSYRSSIDLSFYPQYKWLDLELRNEPERIKDVIHNLTPALRKYLRATKGIIMANNRSDEAANAAADAQITLMGNGYLKLFPDPQPANANSPVVASALAAPQFATAAFPPASAGVSVSNPIITDPSAAFSGTATWMRIYKSDGTSSLYDVTLPIPIMVVAGTPVALGNVTFSENEVQL